MISTSYPISGAKHLDFTGFVLRLEFVGETLDIPVVPAVAELCEMCTDAGDWENPTDQAADYTIDAVSVLGDAGHNTSYCQNHMDARVFVYGPESPEEEKWVVVR